MNKEKSWFVSCKKRDICGFSIRLLWMKDEFLVVPSWEYEFSVQFLWWYFEIMYFKRIKGD